MVPNVKHNFENSLRLLTLPIIIHTCKNTIWIEHKPEGGFAINVLQSRT